MQKDINLGGENHTVQTAETKAAVENILGRSHSENSCYEHSFGGLGNKTRYADAWNAKSDMRPALKSIVDVGYSRIHQKALGPTSGGAGTAGHALIPVYVDARIVDQSRKYTPLVEMIPRVTNMGMYADYNIITAKGAAFTAAADAALTEYDDTEDRQSVAIKYLYSVGRVLGPMQAGMPAYMLEGFQPAGAGVSPTTSFGNSAAPNAKQYQVLMKARAMKELEENLIVNGDASTDATQFSGIVKLQGTTNQKDLASAALTWDDVEDTVQSAFDDGGRPNLAIASSSVVTDLRKIMIDTFRYTPEQLRDGSTLSFGVPSMIVIQSMVGPITVIPSMYLSNTSGAKQIYFLDTDYIEMRVLQDMTYEKLAKTNDSNKFMLKIYECFIMRSTPFNAFIDNIA